MPLDYEFLMGLPAMETWQDLTARDTILYALGVGAAAEGPTDSDELQFVYEDGLVALPSMAVVLAHPGLWAKDPKYGLTWQKVLHAEQSIRIHRPLPVRGRLRGVTTIDEIFDKGVEKGAVLYSSRKIYEIGSDEPLATATQCSFLRGDGGFGGKTQNPKPRPTPDRSPDYTLVGGTRPDQALLYRLSGDLNPLHADPEVARSVGFKAPILHGLATFGVACRLLLKDLAGNDAVRMRRLDVRFSSPVYPGERLELDVWREGDGSAAFRARVPARNAVVLQNGFVELQ